MWLKALKIEKMSEIMDNKTAYTNLIKIKTLHKQFDRKSKDYYLGKIYHTMQDSISFYRNSLRNKSLIQYKISLKNVKSNSSKFIDVYDGESIEMKLSKLKNAFNNLINIEKKNKKYKPLQTTTRYIRSTDLPYFGNEEVGMVHAEFGHIYKLAMKKRAKRLYESKKPDTKDNYIGVEIECYIKENETVLNELLLDVAKNVHIKHDGSLHSRYPGYEAKEFTVLAKESEFDSVITKVCNALSDKRIAARIDTTCGLHVHLDMRNREVETCFHNLVTAQSLLKSMQPESRRKNKYCRNNTHKRFNDTRWGRTRYKNINAQAFDRFNTLEVRLHSGTADSQKIINWVNLLTCIVNKKELVDRCPKSLKKFQDIFNVPMNVIEYAKMRINKFKTNSVEEIGTTEEINNNNATNVA